MKNKPNKQAVFSSQLVAGVGQMQIPLNRKAKRQQAAMMYKNRNKGGKRRG